MKYVHTTILISNLEASVKFYEQQAGLTVQRRFPAGPGKEIAFLADQAGDTCVELMQSAADGVFKGTGISLGFRVADLDKERAAKEAAGLNPGPVISPNPHTRFFYISDPDGVRIQFTEEKK
ncbi:MAG: VOC family protein [Deltaproteobacteria bacterium]|nr:VOC family protein [Deltaproteobacteria bacterium]